MISLRRPTSELRIEIMPLIDVVFLLLTFFIYALVLMIRAELLPLEMQEFASGEPARPAPAVTISIDGDGALYIDREPVSLDDIVPRLEVARREEPGLVVYVAAEKTGSVDRLPTFLTLYDRLALQGLDLRLVGRPKDDPAPPAPQDGP